MTVADSPKKRKRALSPLPTRKIPLHTGEAKAVDTVTEDMASGKNTLTNAKTAQETFDAALKNTEAVSTYSRYHAGLLKEEEDNAWDREVKPKNTSTSEDDKTEKRAAIIIRAVREFERNVVFGNLPSETIPGPETLDMGGQFLTNKDRIDNQSKLYEIAKMVPKGALLHLHFNAELHPERLLEQARDMQNMYIRSIQPLDNQEHLNQTEVVFNVLDPDKVEPDVDIFSSNYIGNAKNWRDEPTKWQVWMPWSKFQQEFEKKPFADKYKQREITVMQEVPHSCSAPGQLEPGQMSLNPAENWLKSKMVLSLDEAYGPTQTVNG
jgi:adenosine deaminase CECR1